MIRGFTVGKSTVCEGKSVIPIKSLHASNWKFKNKSAWLQKYNGKYRACNALKIKEIFISQLRRKVTNKSNVWYDLIRATVLVRYFKTFRHTTLLIKFLLVMYEESRKVRATFLFASKSLDITITATAKFTKMWTHSERAKYWGSVFLSVIHCSTCWGE
jgi:hypothetical protein